jgi:transcriptional regulator with XRE-family HTH domain
MSKMVSYRFRPRSDAEQRALEREMLEELEAEEFERRLSVFEPSAALLRTRTRFNKTQSQMGTITNISLRAYQSYERGEKTVPSTVLCRVAAHFEIDLHELVTGHRSPVDNDTIAALTEDAVKVCSRIFGLFAASGMTPIEARQVAAQVLKWKRPHEHADNDLIFAAVSTVTGDRYLKPEREDLSENPPEE